MHTSCVIDSKSIPTGCCFSLNGFYVFSEKGAVQEQTFRILKREGTSVVVFIEWRIPRIYGPKGFSLVCMRRNQVLKATCKS